jgi:hypothetical protein
MDQELKQYLETNFARMDARFEQIDGRFEQIDGRFERIDERFAEVDRRAEALEERLIGRIEKVETSLLGAFYGWARPMEIRVNGMTSTVMGFDERLALAEQRISEGA